MSSIKTVALAGLGNIGAHIIRHLLQNGFEVTVLSRKTGTEVPAGAKTKVVDYESIESLKSALTGIDAVVSTIGTNAIGVQSMLIDAAAATGVKRFLPSEYGSDTLNKNAAALPVFKPKIDAAARVEEAAKNSQLTYTLVITGPFFDFCLPHGLFDVKSDGNARLQDGGDTPFTTSTMDGVGAAIAAVLKHPKETANTAVYVGSFTTTQNKLIATAKKLGKTEWQISHTTAEENLQRAFDNFKKDPANAMAWAIPMIQGAIFTGKAYNSDFDPVDNERLGLRLLTEAEIEQEVKKGLL